ncbi:DUF4347 domain-containing protein [Limnohabitans sp. Hippo4]|uniref:DUF4347 domain-containing protein n=1 Tax=Limnohabitans sp. Hippo4 TaxID=1826167 RepID=UPI000D35FC80|nr:DUF4347 domain-containing protein [Limnohabitans sp. Hippo4]PUE36626.1 hypothetical protein B9Z46_08015 [Limnohabitans sp. Hippo4]
MPISKILFIDGKVESPDSLIAGIDPSIEVVMLNDQESGLVQMARVLQGRKNVGTVHVMSHGAPGGIWLGNGPITSATLTQDAEALATIRQNLAPGADILLYGCDVGAGEQGQSFIDALSKATGADVAASIDATGKSDANTPSDWSLEAMTGPIESMVINPTDYAYDLGYWQYVGLLSGDPWSINKGSWYTARFDSDGGKYGKGGVGTKVNSSNVSNLYQSSSNWGAESVDFTFRASPNAINGSPWYINNWDYDAGYAILWGAYANNVPTQVAGAASITIGQGTSYTVNLKNLVQDDYYTSPSDFWRYFRGASATNTSYATKSGQSFLVGVNSDKVVTYTASNAASLKGTILLGTVRYYVDDGFDYSRWGSLNPDYYSAYSRYKQAGFVTNIYGSFNNDNITWTGSPANQNWISPSRSEFSFARGAQDPDSIDYVTGYSFRGIQTRTGTDSSSNPVYGTSTTTLPTWLKLAANGTTFYVENLAPEFSDQEYLITVRATSNDGTTIDKTFTLRTGSKAQLNDAPSSAGNSITLNEDTTYTFAASQFNFTDRDNTVGKSTSTLAANGAALQSVKILTLPDASKGTLKLGGTAVAVNASIAVADLGTLTFETAPNASGTASFTYKVNDGIDDANAPSTMTLNVTAINDAPVIQAYSSFDNVTSVYSGDVTTLAATIADTASADTTFTAATGGALSGYLKATDTENTTTTLTVVGGSAAGGVITKVGSYGSLALTSSTGAWIYTPNATAVNQLSTQALDVFTVKATDAGGASSTKNITITVTGANDTPTATALTTQNFNGTGAWSYTVPAATFSDADGNALTYSATLDNGAALPSWLSFDATTRTFKGIPPDDTTYALKVVASDGTLSANATFDLVVGNRAPVLTNPAAYVSKTTHEVSTVTFDQALNAGDVIKVNNVPITINLDAESIETAVATALSSDTAITSAYTVSRDNAANTVTLVSKTKGDISPNLQIAGDAASSVTATITEGTGNASTGTNETVVLTFSAGAYATKSLTIGSSSSITLPSSSISTTQIAQQVAAGTFTGYTTSVSGSTVKFIASTTGDVSDLTVTNSTGGNLTGVTVTKVDGSTGWSYQIPTNIFVDPDGDTLAYTITLDPAPANAANVTITGNTLTGDGSSFNGKILVSASDGNSHTVSTSIGLQVHDGTPTVSLAAGTLPAGLPAGSPAGTIPFADGQGSFNYTIPADLFAVQGAQPTYSATLASGAALPAWLSFNSTTQTFTGNPPGSVTSPVSVKVKAEISGQTAIEQTLNLTVTNADDALVLLSPIGNQTITAGWTGFTLPAANTVFDNPENISSSEPVTGYTQAEYFNGTSWIVMSSGNANNSSGIVFNPTDRKFTGYPKDSIESLRVRVTGETGVHSTGTTEFSFLLPANAAGSGTLSGTGSVGQTLSVSVTDSDGATGTKTHEWQISKDNGSTWLPIASSSNANTYVLTQAEAKSKVRVTSYYTDDRGHTEIVDSNQVTVGAANVTGQVSIVGTPVPGDNLFAQVTDANGISGSVSYQWQRSDTLGGTYTNITGATSASYSLQNEDGSKFIKLTASYTDADGFAESVTVTANGGTAMRLAPIAPVATDDVGPGLTENYGVGNATTGTATSSGNVLTDGTDDSDANKTEVGDTTVLSVAEILLGSAEGVGDASTQTGDRTFNDTTTTADTRSYTLQGLYGSIVMSYNGTYTYTLDQNNPAVQALAEGQTLTEVFNYRIDDGKPAFLSDSATLTFTINGKNDAPIITVRVDKAVDANGAETTTDLPFASVLEDAATYIPTNKLVFTDLDMGATANRVDHDNDNSTPTVNNDFVVTLSVSSGRLTVPDATPSGISIVGSDTSKLTIKGPMVSINSWLSADVVKYLSAPNAVADATLTVTANDGYGAQSSTGHSIVIAGQNDAPVLDMNGSNGAGFSYNVLFRPRGDAIYIVDTDVAISDPDPNDRIIGATIALTSGALDNQFGTTFETLSTTYADTFTLNAGTANARTFTLTGNGTPNLSIQGEGTHADYVTILKTIKYVNDNPNAYGGDREVTIRLTDKSTQLMADGSVDEASRSDSNKAILISAETNGNTAVAAGQRILVDGVDSGNLIAQVLDNKNYIVNKPIKLLTPTSTIQLYKTAVVESAPSATTLVLQVGDDAIKPGQVIKVNGTQKAVVQSVNTPVNGVTTVTTASAHNISVGSGPVTATFETTLPLTEIKSTQVDHVATNVTTSTTLVLADIDIYIEPGQRIFVNGVDSGATVSAIAHDAITKTTVTASAAMTVNTAANITFRTFATNTSPDARAVVNNFWTTEIDLNGILSSGRDYETAFTEGQALPVEIAAGSASLDNQVSKIRTLVVDLSNPKDGDALLVNAAYTIGLLGRGISSALSNNNHTVTISAINQSTGVSSADMQMALRAVQFKNTAENPDVTPRVLNATVTDVTGETGVSAKTTIFITPLNDAPTLLGDFAATLDEGGVYALNSVSGQKEFLPADEDNDVNTLTYTVTSLPANGLTLFRDSNGDGTIDPNEALLVGAKFTHGEVQAGVIKVRQSGADRAFAGFTQTEAQDLINVVRYENTRGTDGLASTQASSGMRKITLASTDTWNASGVQTTTTLGTTTAEVIDTATASTLFTGATAVTLADPGANGYKSITFKVTDVLDGASEQLNFGNVSVPLKPGSYNNSGTVYKVVTGTEVVSSVTKTYYLVTVSKTSYALGLNMADGGQDGSLPVPTSVDFTITPINDAPTLTASPVGNASFTEGNASPTTLFQSVSLSTGDTSGVAQTISSIAVTVSDVQNDADEKLHLGNQAVALTPTTTTAMTVVLNSQNYSVNKAVTVTNGVATVTLSGNQTAAVWQALLGSLAYSNASSDPIGTSRKITITTVTDSGSNSAPNVNTATFSLESNVGLIAVNVAPVFDGTKPFTQSVLDGATQTIGSGQLAATDADGNSATAKLSYSLLTLPSKGQLFIDANSNGVADFGEQLVLGTSSTQNGQYRNSFTQTDLNNNLLNYQANGTTTGTDTFSLSVSDGIAAAINHDFTVSIVPASTVRGAINTAATTDVFTNVSVATLPAGQTIKSLTFTVSGVTDPNEKLTISGTDVALFNGNSVTVGTSPNTVTYTVSVDAQGKATVVVTDDVLPGFTNIQAASLIDSITYSNTSTPATVGSRVIEMTSMVNYTASGQTLPETPIQQGTVTATPSNPVTDVTAGTSVTSSTDGTQPLFSSVDVNMPTGEVINTLSFTVDNVLDGNKEVLTIDGTAIGLGSPYPHTVAGTGVTYTVSLGQDGQVLVTAVYATALSETAIEATLASVRYENTEVPPTAGQRLVSVASMGDSAHPNDAIAVDLIGVVNVKTSLDPFGSSATNALDTAVPTGGAVQSLTFTVDGIVDGANEVLKINGQEVPLVNGTVGPVDGCTYTVTVVNGKATVLVSASPALTETQAQTLLDSVTYTNNAEPATSAVKSIELTQVGVLATSTATTATQTPISGTEVSATLGTPAFDPFSAAEITQVNSAITSATTGLTFTVSGVKDGSSEVLKFGTVTVPLVPGTVGPTANGITYTVTVINGTATVVASGLNSEAQGESLVADMTYQNTANPATSGERTVNLASVSAGVTSTNVNLGGAVQILGELPTPQSIDPFGSAAVTAVDNAVPTGSTVGALTFTVQGVSDGAKEIFTINGQAVPLIPGTVTIDGVTYSVAVNGSGTATITVSTGAPGFTEAQAKTMVDGASYTNTDSTPTAGAKTITLQDIAVITGGVSSTVPLNDLSAGVVIGNGALSPLSSSDLTTANAAITGTPSSLTFTVSGVKDGGNEVLKFGNTVVPLINGTTVGPIDGITYTISVDADGVATVVASGMTSEAAAESLVAGMTYQNTDSNPTVGDRTVALTKVGATTVSGVSGSAQIGSGSVPNVAPVLTVNGFTMLEGGIVNVTKDMVSVTDADDALETLKFKLTGLTDATLFRDSNYNGVVNPGEEIGVGQSFAYQDIVNGVLKIRHDGDQPNSNSLSLSVSDGTTTVSGSHVFTVTNVNDAPIGLPTITGQAKRAMVLTANTSGIQDADLFNNPANLSYQWKADGIDINSATNSTYTVARADIGKKITVLVSYTDAGSRNESVLSLPTEAVQNVNEAPTLSAGAISVAEGGSITLTTSQVNASDGDGLGSNHLLTLANSPTHGTLYLDQNGDANLDVGESLADNSQFAWTDLAAGKVRYKHDGSEENDSFQLRLSDSQAQTGFVSFAINRTAVNDAPVIYGLNTVSGASVVNDVLTYATSGTRQLLDQGSVFATISDSDSADFDTGVLRVSIAQNRNAARDVLSIESITTEGHTVSLDTTDTNAADGINIKYDNTVIGSVKGGSGANDLEVTFNANANSEKVAAVIRSVAFTNLEKVPANSSRVVAFELSDGDGGTSAASQVSINLTASAAPIIQNNASEIYVQENNLDVGFFVALDPGNKALTYSISTSAASNNADRGKFVISAAGLLQFTALPDYENPTDVGSNNAYQVIVKATNSDGLADESILTVNVTNATTGVGENEGTPPNFLVATVNGAQLALMFADANLLDGTNLPSTSQFTVTSNGQPVPVSGYLVNTGTKVVTLTLGRSIAYGENVLVSFNDPSAQNDVNTLQDIYGNDVVSFSGQSALVLTPMPEAVTTGGGSTAPIPIIVPKTDTNIVTTTTAETAVKSVVYVAADGTKKIIEGDGNGDGIKDSAQNAVLSVPLKISDSVSTAGSTTPESYITLVTASVSGKVSANEVAAITEINQLDAPAGLPDNVKMPLGLIAFKSTLANVGAKGSFSLYVDPTLDFNGYWKQNGQGVWTNLATPAYGGQMTMEDTKMRIDFVIQDGGEFDEDGVVNGVIVDPGALGELQLSVMGSVATMPLNILWF